MPQAVHKPGPQSGTLFRLVRGLVWALLEQNESRAAVPSGASEPNAEVLAQLHAAEYASERNSVDVWKTLQYAVVPIIFVAWSLLVQLRDALPTVVLWWACGAVLPLCYVAYQKAMVDALTGLLLIEERVRPRAIALAGTDEFWFHEPVYRKKVKPDAAYGWFWPPVLSFASPLAVLAWHVVMDHSFSKEDWWGQPPGYGDVIGYSACCLVAWFVGNLSKKGLALNRQIGEHIRRRQFSWLEGK